MTPISFVLHPLDELAPGPRWQALFAATWPAYRRWWLSEGIAARPSLEEAAAALTRHMPELVPTWHRLVALAGGGSIAARMLSLYQPPPSFVGCSQAVVRGPAPALVRNYDYDPRLFERVVARTAYTGRVIVGTGDCLWGLLDGMNDTGLVVSLAFGGHRALGAGFAIPLVVRYLLETCQSVADARAALRRVPVAQAYNLTMLDRSGAAGTMLVHPHRHPRWLAWDAATNHQERLEWPEFAGATRSVERQRRLRALLDAAGTDVEQVVAGFLRPPVHSFDPDAFTATLYTVVYSPLAGTISYRWPGDPGWHHSLAGLAAGPRPVAIGPWHCPDAPPAPAGSLASEPPPASTCPP